MVSRRGLVLAGVIAGVTSQGGPAHAASYFVSVNASSGTTQVSGPTNGNNSSSAAPVALSASSQIATPSDYGSAASSAAASASAGTLKVTGQATASSTAPGCCSGGGATGSAQARWSDTFVVRSNQFADGTTATLVARILIDGTMPVTTAGGFWSSLQSWSWNFGLAGLQWSEGTTVSGDAINGFRTSGAGFGYRDYTANIVLGQGVAMGMDIFASAQGNAGGFGGSFVDATTDLGHTVTWRGISSLTVNGAAVTDFTAVSESSGFNFRAGVGAVPEPGTWLLMMCGIGVLGAMLRRRGAVRFLAVAG